MNLSGKYFSGILLATFISTVCVAQVRLPELVSDHMVLQRNAKINLWGWASPHEKITIRFNGKVYHTTAQADSTWKLMLPQMKAGGPFQMQIAGKNKITINDVYLGDVWFCSGQSNMVLPMERVKEKYPQEIAEANYPEIRNFFIPTVSDVTRVHEHLPPGSWLLASPKNVLGFGAASYFFAKKLYLKYHVPIGIINSSVGGTPVQAWISAEGIKDIPPYAQRVAQFKDASFIDKISQPKNANNSKPALEPDKGLSENIKWYDTAFIAKNWHHFFLPGYWADQGIRGLNGVVWFRKEVDVPAGFIGKPAKLYMGRIVDADETYVNGKKVGGITYQYPPRRYDIPDNLLHAGKNLIVVRITNFSGKGGFVPDKKYYLAAAGDTLDLRGDWQYKVGQVFPPNAGMGGGYQFSAQNEPTGLYNTMVAPAIPYTIKGFVWYQGESNTGKPKEYGQLLKALIADWRGRWQQGSLPFIYAQLPNFNEVEYSPTESNWAELRQQQLETLSVPNTGMAVAIDAGEWNDIHPLDKKDVGDRLALAAEKLAYGEKNLIAFGPIYQSAKIEGNQIVLSFSSVGSGLIAKGDEGLMQFAIAGADKKFVWADAKISGNEVIVSSKAVANPKYVRYAWADNPEGANLYNQEGLPASPFETKEIN